MMPSPTCVTKAGIAIRHRAAPISINVRADGLNLDARKIHVAVTSQTRDIPAPAALDLTH